MKTIAYALVCLAMWVVAIVADDMEKDEVSRETN